MNMQCIHIPELCGGMRTSSRMLSPRWTTCVSAQTAAVLEISLAAARTATTTTAPAPPPLGCLSGGCRLGPGAASVISVVAARTTTSLLPAQRRFRASPGAVSETGKREETKAMAMAHPAPTGGRSWVYVDWT